MQNLEFKFESPIVFKAELSEASQRFHETALFRARRYLLAEADLLEAIIAIDKDKTYEKLGLTHLTPYCVKYLGLTEDVAGNFVRVARKSLQIPALKDAVHEGLSVTKAKTIASVIKPSTQEEWISKAKTLSKHDLEKAVAQVSPQAPAREKKKVKAASTRFEFELNDEGAELTRRAQDLVSQKLGRPATFAETQMYLLKNFLKHEDPVEKAKRQPSRDGSVKKQVYKRDQGRCQAKLPDGTLCSATRWIHLHHIKPRAEGGEDTAENLITLCSAHHRMWHRKAAAAPAAIQSVSEWVSDKRSGV